jgi:hypothetical protein
MKKALLMVAAYMLTGCSSIQSLHSPERGKIDGLTYYMPKRDFIVTVEGDGKNIININLEVSGVYADTSTQYVLAHGSNVFGKNTLDVAVDENGLLTSTKSTTVSKVSDALKGLASTAAAAATLDAPIGTEAESEVECTQKGSRVFVFSKAGVYHKCNNMVTITIAKRTENPNASGGKGTDKPANKFDSGVYYRLNQPYLVSASIGSKGVDKSALFVSPSESPTFFLPASRTFFSDNSAEFGFEKGIPTKFKQETEGEVVALLKLPADIISAYFSAIGSIFDAFKGKDTKEIAALNESLKLDLARMKREACVKAIADKDQDSITKLKCGE